MFSIIESPRYFLNVTDIRIQVVLQGTNSLFELPLRIGEFKIQVLDS